MFNISKNIVKQALDLSPVPTVIVDLKATPPIVAYVNQAFEAVSGFDAGELLGHSWDELTDHANDPSTDNVYTATFACHSRLGAEEQLALEMLPLYDKPGMPRYWVGTEQPVSDVTIQEQDVERDALLSVLRDARMHLRRLDGRDSATGLLNRRTFDDLLRRDWLLARREKRSLGLIVFQLDGFDGYREVYGRHAADSCLRKVAHAITGSLRRAGDLTARFADDRFIVLVGDCDETKASRMASAIADKVRGLSIHHPRSPRDRFITVSFGAASAIPTAAENLTGLIAAAELKLSQQSPEPQVASASST